MRTRILIIMACCCFALCMSGTNSAYAMAPESGVGGCIKTPDGKIDCSKRFHRKPKPTQPVEPPRPRPLQCTMDVKICPDGSAVGRVPPSCKFQRCRGEDPICPMYALQRCEDGFVMDYETLANGCERPYCRPVICPMMEMHIMCEPGSEIAYKKDQNGCSRPYCKPILACRAVMPVCKEGEKMIRNPDPNACPPQICVPVNQNKVIDRDVKKRKDKDGNEIKVVKTLKYNAKGEVILRHAVHNADGSISVTLKQCQKSTWRNDDPTAANYPASDIAARNGYVCGAWTQKRTITFKDSRYPGEQIKRIAIRNADGSRLIKFQYCYRNGDETASRSCFNTPQRNRHIDFGSATATAEDAGDL